MRRQETHSGKTFQRLLAVALVLWLAGVGCFFGCELRVSAAPVVESGAIEEGETCAVVAGGHDCCAGKRQVQKHGVAAAESPLPPVSGQTACCALVPQPADPARKIILDESSATHASISSAMPALPVKHSSAENPPTLRVPDRGSTYLRCCAFLI